MNTELANKGNHSSSASYGLISIGQWRITFQKSRTSPSCTTLHSCWLLYVQHLTCISSGCAQMSGKLIFSRETPSSPNLNVWVFTPLIILQTLTVPKTLSLKIKWWNFDTLNATFKCLGEVTVSIEWVVFF